MKAPTEEINKPLVGVLAVVCLVSSLVISLLYPAHQATYAALLRVGLVLGAFWVALPALSKTGIIEKLTPLIALGMALIAIFQKKIIVLVPVLALLLVVGILSLVLRSGPKQRPRSRGPHV